MYALPEKIPCPEELIDLRKMYCVEPGKEPSLTFRSMDRFFTVRGLPIRLRHGSPWSDIVPTVP